MTVETIAMIWMIGGIAAGTILILSILGFLGKRFGVKEPDDLWLDDDEAWAGYNPAIVARSKDEYNYVWCGDGKPWSSQESADEFMGVNMEGDSDD